LARAIRAHANCAEYAPIGIILIGLAESLAVPAPILHGLGIGLVAGRVVHAYGVSQEPENLRFRVAGMGLTITAIAVAASAALIGAIPIGCSEFRRSALRPGAPKGWAAGRLSPRAIRPLRD
jgi:uncharacterized protein